MNPSKSKGSEALVGAVTSPLRAIRPLHDNVLLEVLGRGGQEEVLASGLVRPATVADSTRTRGLVLAVGPGKLLEKSGGARKPVSVSVGQEVTFELGAGTLLRVEGREFLMVTDEQITGVVETVQAPLAPDQCPACRCGGLSMERLDGACHALECPDPTAWLRHQKLSA